MGNTSDRRSLGRDPFEPPTMTPGPLGKNDPGEPFSDTTGDTPGPAGTGGDRAQQLAVEPGVSIAIDPSKYSLLDSKSAGTPAADDQSKDTSAALKTLIDAQDDVMDDVSLAAGEMEITDAKGKKTKVHATHCSEASFRVAQKTGAPWDGILGSKDTNFDANTQIDNLAKAATEGTYKTVEPDEAQNLANKGVTVFATQPKPTHGHIATVRPENVKGDSPRAPYKKPLLANVGRINAVTGYLGVHGKTYGEFVVGPGDEPVVFYAPAK